MGGIRLEETTKIYPNGVKAIDDVSLDIHDGEFMVLVGPSGCGKSTLLRMIAGLEEVTEGRILIGERDVTDLRPRDRDIAMVFQNYALYPHMTVEENLGFGLKLRRVSREERKSRVGRVAGTLGLKELMGRRPALLSGGQRQRVAMGRAMVREPTAFLMDEPLSNLDAKLRVAMRGELTRLHERLRVTTVYVTHDQVEAMTLGQRVAVMLDGVLQQCDTPQVLFHRPANLFVAAFMGSPSMNVVEAEVADGRVRFAGLEIPLTERSPLADARRSVILGVRPSDLRHPDEAPTDLPRIRVRPDVIEELGGLSNLHFPLDAPRVHTDATRAAIEATSDDDATLLADDGRARFCASIDGRREVVLGGEIELAVDHQYLHFFDPVSGVAITSSDGVAAA
jgi:multiple sugar transport system ATP-binding protein